VRLTHGSCRQMGAVETRRELAENLKPVLPRQMNHALKVVRLWEQVDQMHLLDPVTAAQENDKITGQRRRIAGDVNHA